MNAPVSPLDILCIGGAVVDLTYQSKAALVVGSSNPCTVHTSYGGVARNIAENLARLGRTVGFVSAVGNDDAGQGLLAYMRSLDINVSACLVNDDITTAQYVAVLDEAGSLHMGLAAMEGFETLLPTALEAAKARMQDALWVFADTNLPTDTVAALLASKGAWKLAVDAVSVAKAGRLPRDLTGVDVLFANRDEACAMAGASSPEDCAAHLLELGAGSVVITLGADGHLVADESGVLLMDAEPTTVVNVTGAGDALIAGTLHGLMDGLLLAEASRRGAELAALTLASSDAVACLSDSLEGSLP